MAIFTLGPFAGPALGPTIGGFIGDNTSWRWLFWVMAGFVGVSSHDLYIRTHTKSSDFHQAAGCELLIIFFVPETYA